MWDVYAACERVGSLDSAIQHAQLNDLSSLRQRCPQLRAIAHNGGESYKHAKAVDTLLNRANHGPDSANHSPDPRTPIEVFKLPSSSPANASWSFERKLQVWQSVLEKYAP